MPEAPEGMISIEEFAKNKGIKTTKIVNMIRDGFYVGRKVGDDWFIDASESTGTVSKPSKVRVAVSSDSALNHVVVTDIQMTFLSMVVFMVKWAIASIPALIILFIIFSLFGGFLVGVVGGLRS